MESIRNVRSQRVNGEAERPADVMTWATETLHDEIQLAFVDRLSDRATQIQAALERIAQRDYGICRDCHGFIGVARLKALPFAQRCRPCQERVEENQVARSSGPAGLDLSAEDDE